jgi:hypothetical protein
MSETFQHKIERLEHEATLPAPEQHKSLPEHAAKALKAEQAEELQEARNEVSELAQAESSNPVEQQLRSAENTSQAATPGSINRELRQITLNRELLQLQRKLPALQARFSKVIHQPAVRAVSEAAGKTVSRPSGLLGGGIVALVGTSIYLYMANHYGFAYNPSVFLLFLAIGFGLGLVLELIVHLTMRSRHAHD